MTRSPAFCLPKRKLYRRFPELTVLRLLDAALAAAEQSLLAQYPDALDLPVEPQDSVDPALLTAHLIVSRAAELRHLLELYSALCHPPPLRDDLDEAPAYPL